ncbi:MAG: NUDIX hydrolase [Chloroflexi bacterium]|nr:NUDIX hydrolase [Chloroflexota bacterium]
MTSRPGPEGSDRRDYPERPICAVGVVVRKEGAALLIRRGNPPRQGDWSLPGGAVELGETLREAADREVLEECGVEITLGDLVDTFEFVVRDGEGRVQFHYVILDYVANYHDGILRPASDVVDAQWVPLSALDAFELAPKTREVIEKAFRRESI